MALLALGDRQVSDRWEQVCQQLQVCSFDRFDYVAMKFMILLNAGESTKLIFQNVISFLTVSKFCLNSWKIMEY